MKQLRRFCQQSSIGIATLVLSLALITPRDAEALTFVLDFDNTFTDIFNEQTGAFNETTYGFTGGLSNAQVEQALLAAIYDHFLGYVTSGVDGSSPLADGTELDIDFQIGTANVAPTNGDGDWWAIKIGDGISGTNATDSGIFGAACGSCVRDASGTSDFFNIGTGSLVGSIWTDHIDDIAGLASNNAELINLIAGTISHEIGHTLSLPHAGAMAANPGASNWGVMGSGATAMPIGDRVLEREWTYANMTTLITSVGVRDVVAVPEPGTLALFSIGLLLLGAGHRRRRSSS